MSDDRTVRVQVDLSLRWVEEVTVTVRASLTGEELERAIGDRAVEKARDLARQWLPLHLSGHLDVVHTDLLDEDVQALVNQPTWPPPARAIYTLMDGSRWATDRACIVDVDRCACPAPRKGESFRGWIDFLTAEAVEGALRTLRTVQDHTSEGWFLAWQTIYTPVLKSGTARTETGGVVAVVERDGRVVATVAASLLNPGDRLDRYVDIRGEPFPMAVVPELPTAAGVSDVG